MAAAELLLREKGTDGEGNLYELTVWRVTRTPRYREGVRYRLVFIMAGENWPAVLYDNHHPKGHHRHLGGAEEPYDFTDLDRLLEDFFEDAHRALEQSK